MEESYGHAPAQPNGFDGYSRAVRAKDRTSVTGGLLGRRFGVCIIGRHAYRRRYTRIPGDARRFWLPEFAISMG